MAKKLINMEIDEVSAVDLPANNRKFLIVKSEDGGDVDSLHNIFKRTLEDQLAKEEASRKMWDYLDALWSAVDDTLWSDIGEEEKAVELETTAMQFAERIKGIAPDLAKRFIEKQEEQGGLTNMDLDKVLEKLGDEELEVIQSELAKKDEKIKELSESDESQEDDITKGMSDEVRKRFDEMQERLVKAEETATAERLVRKKAEFSKKAEVFKSVAPVEDISDILLKAYDIDNEFGEKLESVISTAKERISTSAINKEAGSNSGEGTDVMDTIMSKAKEIQKSDSAISIEKAITKVLEQEPKLYAEYNG